jgi:4'-phosphopantetheinyl transferase
MGAIELSPGAPPRTVPERDEVHLRIIDLRQPAEVESALACFLSRDEGARADRFQTSIARSRFVMTRGWLRVVLASALDLEPGQIEFSYGTNGKPALAGTHHGSPLSFNVSHSGGYALIGTATAKAIGVDIEQIRPMPRFLDMATDYFSAAEARDVMARPEADRLRAFFRCWTRKEAFMKATGDGLGIALNGFSVSLDDGARGVSMADPADRSGAGWTVCGVSVGPGCEAAIAIDGAAARVCAWHDPVLI